jgi:peptidoglycan/LPS O-acetylase OafA/YrhL
MDTIPVAPPAATFANKKPSDNENPGGFVHIPALDGIRGTAILLVLLYHLLWSNWNTGSPLLDIVQRIRATGYIGVNLFFVLSGFLITGILIDTLNIPHFFKTFYVRRTLRIFPLYYGSLILLLLLTHPLHFVWNGWQYYFLTYTSNLALWRLSVPLHLGFFNINHFWSLQVEEQFYLVWPFIVYRIRRPAALVRIALAGCTLALVIRIVLVALRGHPHFQNVYLPYSPTFSCVDNILFGCALCSLLRTRWRATVMRLAPRVFWTGVGLLLVTFVLNRGLDWESSAFMPTFGFSILGITFAALVATTLRSGSGAQRLFQQGFLRFFGRYSYGIYVFHYSIDGALTGPLRAAFNSHLHSKPLAVLLSALIVAALSVLVALLSYHLFEIRFLRLKRYFGYRAATPVPLPAA